MKNKLFILFFIITTLLTACGTDIEPKEHLSEIYSVALDSMIGLDEALNHEMKYIAIDMSNLEDLDENDKDNILNYFEEKYKLEVMNASFEQLKEMGLFNPDTMSLNGILLRIEKVDFKFNKSIYFEGSKYRSGLGAIGVEVTVRYNDNNWKTKKANITWVS